MLEEWIREKSNKGPGASFLRSRKGQYILIILICLGLLALIWPVKDDKSSSSGIGVEAAGTENYRDSRMSRELESILAKIDGAGQVDVSITLASGGVKTYAANVRNENRESSESDRQGGSKSSLEQSSTQDIAVSSGSPLLIEERNPQIMGVLIVADGARLPEVREKLTNAAATLLDLPVHKVQVMPRKGGIE
jgi:stage III sporulation protein AG